VFIRRPLIGLVAMASSATLVAACGSSGNSGQAAGTARVCQEVSAVLSDGGSSSGSGQSITLYNGQHEQTTDSLVAGFEKATGITVNVRNDDEDTLADEIVTEGSRSPADVIYTENSPALEYLQDKGLLAPSTPRPWPTHRASTTRPRATGSGCRPG
jgi:ABC-type glycerol-3-phosphate transport system substrate-binding protein